MPHCHWWGLLFLFFFLQENNKIRLTATGGAFFSFFLQKNLNVRSNHHKLFYRWIWDKFFFFFFDVRYGINFYLCLSSFFFLLRKVCFYLNLLLIYQLPTISDVCKIIYDF